MTRSLTGQSVCQGIVCDHDRSALTKRSVSNIYVSACDDISNGFKQFLDGCPMVRISGPGSCRYSAGDAGSRELRTCVLSRVSWSGPRTSQSGFDRNGYGGRFRPALFASPFFGERVGTVEIPQKTTA
jgi:hypothetical protein